MDGKQQTDCKHSLASVLGEYQGRDRRTMWRQEANNVDLWKRTSQDPLDLQIQRRKWILDTLTENLQQTSPDNPCN